MSGFSRIGLAVILPFIILVIAYAIYKLFLIPEPTVAGTEGFKYLSAEKTVRLQTENLKEIDIYIYQDGKMVPVMSDIPEVSGKIYSLQVKPKDLGLTDGSAVTVIKAKSGILKEARYEIESVVDTVPPTLTVLSSPSFINRGSGGFALLRAKGADSVFIKLVDTTNSVEDREFTAFKSLHDADSETEPDQGYGDPDASASGSAGKSTSSSYYVFFPAPFDIKGGSVFYAVARDMAGNQSVRALKTRINLIKYKESSITIDDSFINTVVSPLLNETNITDPAGAFRKVNETWREDNQKKIAEISMQSADDILWKGRFLQLKNSKVMATYGDQRTYYYGGKQISDSVHLGYDLASHAFAPVEAANSGIIRFAGNLGIYGNAVIIDHGMGLMSLYGHLSAISVSEDQPVEKGELIGKTGATGLAGGDHLHFGILMHGYEVSPLYWWDSHWIKVNITDVID